MNTSSYNNRVAGYNIADAEQQCDEMILLKIEIL